MWRSGRLSLNAMSEVTRILNQIDDGDPSAATELLPLVYEELRKLAAHRIAKENPGQTLQATALVHEAYLRLVGGDGQQHWDNRGHFFAAAAEAIRRILIEQARKKNGPKAGGDRQRIELEAEAIPFLDSGLDIVELSDALEKLEEIEARAAELVKLRFFAGLSIKQAADIVGISVSTAKNDWAYAKNWLRAELIDAV